MEEIKKQTKKTKDSILGEKVNYDLPKEDQEMKDGKKIPLPRKPIDRNFGVGGVRG